MREADLETAVCRHARLHGGWRSIKLNGRGDRGKPDRLFFRGPPAEIKFIEVKRHGKKARPLQTWWIRLLNHMGFDAYVVDNIDDAKRIFTETE